MASIIGLPKLSPTMEEGVLAKWHRKEGDKVAPGDVIAEVETDKANMDFPLEDEGTLLKLLVKEGDTVKLGAPVAILGQPGEDVSAIEKQARAQMAGAGTAMETAKEAPKPGVEASKAAPAQPTAAEAPPRQPTPTPAPKAAPEARPAAPEPRPTGGDGAGRILASPLAKTLAAEHGVDLRTLRGTGPGGRIIERDVQAALSAPAPAPAPAPPAAAPTPAPPAAARPAGPPAGVPERRQAPRLVPDGEEYLDKGLSMMRKTIARRISEAKATVPHFYLTADCNSSPLSEFRVAISNNADDIKVSLNDLIVKAAALALRRVPQVNASFLGDHIRYHGRVHIGVAVAIEDGLLTPVIRDADRKGVAQIGAEIREMAVRARQKKLLPEEITGGTFTVSNLGMYGIDHFEAIINPPEGAILAIGRSKKVPVVNGDKLEIGERMALTLSCDHRVVDGAVGAQFLQALIKIIEHPAALAL